MSNVSYWVLVPAAGIGKRMGSAIPKQYLPLVGQPVIAHTLTTLLAHPRIAGVTVVISAEDEWWPTVAAELAVAAQSVVIPCSTGLRRYGNGLRRLIGCWSTMPPGRV